MPPLARRNLFHDKVRLTVTLTGIVFAVVLIVVELGLFVGFTSTTSGLVDHSGADLWVTSTNVPYIEQGVAFSERKLNQVRAIPSVGDAEKYIAHWTQWKRFDGSEESVQIVGFNVDSTMGQPWNLVQGRIEDLKTPDAIILDDSTSKSSASPAWVRSLKSTVDALVWSGSPMAFVPSRLRLTSLPASRMRRTSSACARTRHTFCWSNSLPGPTWKPCAALLVAR